ncbi:MAG: hypothetical protein KDA96_17655 [Planctomycetaceae bacterium]|nr:hypothetical protein [Planctomycetaceae bacterium]
MKSNMFSRFPVTAAILFVFAVSGSAFAQGPARSELDLLTQDDIQQQLGLSPGQIEKLEELKRSSNPGTDFFRPYLERIGQAADDAERSKIREEMNQAVAEARGAFQSKAVEVLSDSQKRNLRRLFIERAGVRAFADPRVAGDLGLTDEQKTKMTELSEQRREASRQMGFDVPDEQQQKFEEEWTGKFLAVLTDEQRTKWQEAAAPSTVAVVPAPGGVVPPPGGSVPAPGGDMPVPEGAEVVATFGAVTTNEGDCTPVETVKFNFKYAPWDQVLEAYAAATCQTLDITDKPPGTFTHLSNTEYSVDDALDVLNGYLLRKGFVLLRKDGFLVCWNTVNEIPEVLVPDITLDELPSVGENQIVRIKIDLKDVDTNVMAQEAEHLLSKLGRMTAFTQTGRLIIRDVGSNLRLINTFLQDVAGADALIFKSYPVAHMPVEEAEIMLLTQFGMRAGTVTNVSSSAEDARRRSGGSQNASSAANLQVAADTRTNSLLVTGTSKQHLLVVEILKAVDVEATAGLWGNSGPFLRSYFVQGDAREIAKSIDAMMPGVVVNEDGRSGFIHIYATDSQHQQVQEWVNAFNEGGGAGAGEVAVIQLQRMDPLSASATLRSLFYAEGDDAPTIEVDLYGRRLIVRGTAAHINQIRKVLADLGETGEAGSASGSGPIRRYNIPGRDPQEFLDYVRGEWEKSESNPVRIVIPNQPGPIRDLRTPAKGSLFPGSEPARSSSPAPQPSSGQEVPDTTQNAPQRPDNSQFVSVVTDESVNESSATEGGHSAGANPPDSGIAGEGIEILVLGDELILTSNDEAALDRMEELLDFLQQTIPYRTEWTVFYLQVADATETAAMLEELFPNSSVSTSSTTSGGFSLGNMFRPITDTVSDLSGLGGLSSPQTLRIIPDTRSNSLFVTGPKSVLADVENVLQVLDSNEIPESLRDMQPRAIVVEHADIDEVGNIVKEIFKPYTEVQGGGRNQQQQNPFAALMGGGGGRNEAQQVRMTISVDRQNSSLIVSSSEDLFMKVEDLVNSLDETARTSNRSVRVLQLKNVDATLIQQSITSMFPRVTSSSSRPGSPSSSSSSSGTPGPPSGGSQDDAARQQAFRDMMQQRMGGGGGPPGFGSGGGPTFGGRPSFGGFGGSTGGRPSFGGRGGR